MSGNMPSYDPAALDWLEARITGWVADPTSVGLTSATATSLAVDIINARTAFTSVQEIRGESKLATNTFKAKAKIMRDAGSLAIAEIKSFANNAASPETVYETANVEPRSPNSPAAPPSQPATLNATLNGDGSVTINFEGTGPTGTVWQVSRQLASETTMSFVGNAVAATKSFTDTDVPQGTASAQYQIKGVRGDLTGPASFAFLVKFGTPAAASGESAQVA